jgi:hypothetical protein
VIDVGDDAEIPYVTQIHEPHTLPAFPAFG